MAVQNTSTPQHVYVVTGASRGIGLAFVSQLLKDGSKVFAAARNPAKAAGLQELLTTYPETLTLVTLESSSEESIQAAAAEIEAALPEGSGVDVLINNAAIAGADDKAFTRGFPDTTRADMLETFTVNVVGAYSTAAALLPLLRKGVLKKIVNISSSAACLGASAADARVPGWTLESVVLAYRVSKAALSMVTTVTANGLKAEGFTVIAIHPGWVATDMGMSAVDYLQEKGVPLSALPPRLTPAESVAAQLKTIGTLGAADTAAFVQWDGKPMEW